MEHLSKNQQLVGAVEAKTRFLSCATSGRKVCQRQTPTKKEKRRNQRFSDPETDPDATEKRNKYVGLKFQTMRKQGKIPQHILDVVDSAVTRSGKTSLMNKLFQKRQEWQLDHANQPPFFQTYDYFP